MPKLIVTNGESAAERLRAAGIKGHILPWQDMLHDGPVPPGTDLEEVSDVRADFLSEALGLPFDEVRADFGSSVTAPSPRVSPIATPRWRCMSPMRTWSCGLSTTCLTSSS